MAKLLSLIPLFAPVLVLGILLVLRPQQLVRVQGTLYRLLYKGLLKQTDDEIDRRFMLPHDRYFVGMRSEFLAEGPTNPEKFSRLILVHRILGAVILLLMMGACGIASLAVMAGAAK